jgi:hypothetical protein
MKNHRQISSGFQLWQHWLIWQAFRFMIMAILLELVDDIGSVREAFKSGGSRLEVFCH